MTGTASNVTGWTHLRWFRYVSHTDSWVNQCLSLDVVGKQGKGQPLKTRDGVFQVDLKP